MPGFPVLDEWVVEMMHGLALLALALLSGAQPPQAPDEPGQQVVVEGRSIESVDRFVASLTQTRGERQLSRWNGHICPRVVGLEPGHAAFILRRLQGLARELRIPVATRNCRGNVVIVVTGDADEFVATLVQRHPRLFRGPRDNLASPAEIAQLLEPRPVRWIAASDTGNSEGRVIYDREVNIYSASRLTLTSRENMAFSFIIVDAGRLQNLRWGQLADYLSLVALARPAMDAPYDPATILSLFRLRDQGGQPPAGLTRQDRSFLRALYTTNPATRAHEQREAIRARLREGEQVAQPE